MLLGFQPKFYYALGGIGGTPTWVEITNATSVAVPRKSTSKSVTPRSMAGVEGNVAGLFQLGGQLKFPYLGSTDPVYLALLTASTTRAIVGVASLAGLNGEGPRFDAQVFDVSLDEPEDGGPVMVSVDLKPAVTSNAPVPAPVVSVASADVIVDGVELSFAVDVVAAQWTAAWLEVSTDGITWHHGTTVTRTGFGVLHFTGFGFNPDNTYRWRLNNAPVVFIAPEFGVFP